MEKKGEAQGVTYFLVQQLTKHLSMSEKNLSPSLFIINESTFTRSSCSEDQLCRLIAKGKKNTRDRERERLGDRQRHETEIKRGIGRQKDRERQGEKDIDRDIERRTSRQNETGREK